MYDIIIVGSGPAGTSTALHLAQIAPHLAERTLVLERGRHPRPKLCGGGLLQDGEAILRRLGLDVTALPHQDVLTARFHFEDRQIPIRRAPVSFRVFERPRLDAWLVRAMLEQGVTLHEDTPVRSVHPNGACVEVLTDQGTYQGHVVVGADGSNSITRRAVTREPGQVARLLKFVVPPGDPVVTPARQTEADFDFSIIPWGSQGYAWDFPMLVDGEPARNQGIYDTRYYPDAPHGNLPGMLRQITEKRGLELDDYHVKGHPIRGFSPQAPLAMPRVLLVGDAAGTDPCFGEGIPFSLAYGELAAQEIAAAFDGDDFSFAGYQRRVLRSALGRNLMRRYRLGRVLYRLRHPRWQRLLWGPLGPAMRWIIEHRLIDWAR